MKNILKIITIFIVCNASAQTIIPIENQLSYNLTESSSKYFKDVNGVYNKFLGTWKYQNSPNNPTEILEVIFYKKEHYAISDYYEDRIYARFKYTKNGQVIFNILNGTDESLNHMIFGGTFADSTNTNKMALAYFEPDEELWTRKSRLYVEYLPQNPAKLLWSLDWYPLDDNVPEPKMPVQITLIKQP